MNGDGELAGFEWMSTAPNFARSPEEAGATFLFRGLEAARLHARDPAPENLGLVANTKSGIETTL
jgi:hypothetical protein